MIQQEEGEIVAVVATGSATTVVVEIARIRATVEEIGSVRLQAEIIDATTENPTNARQSQLLASRA